MHTTLASPSAHRRLSAGGAAGLVIVAVIGMVFVIHDALPYFRLTEAQLGRYGPHRPWLVVHITAGIIALLSGLSLPRVTTGFQAIHRRS